MLKPEQVPYNVTREALTAWMGSEGTIMSAMERAIAAALNVWPGMSEENRNGFSFTPLPHGTAFRYTVLILPLPTEKPDADSK